jgi:hypothetical protein
VDAATQAHGGYLSRFEDVDVSWLTRVAREALEEDGQPTHDAGLLVSVLPGARIIRFAWDGAFSYGRGGARWYLTHHALARRLSAHLSSPVHAYVYDAEELEQVVAYGNGRRVGGEALRYDDVELPDEDLEFERLKMRWPLGHLARVLGIDREQLLRLPRRQTALLELSREPAPQPLWQLFPDALSALQQQQAFVGR